MEEDEPSKFSNSENTSINSEDTNSTALAKWLETVEDLPHDVDMDVLLTFLNWAKDDVQKFVTNFYRARQHYYQIFCNRSPSSKPYLKYSSVMVAPFTTSMSPQWKIFGTWLLNDDYQKFSLYHQIRLIFAELDLNLQENCLLGKRIVIIMDMALMTENHFLSITRFAAKNVSKLLISAVPAELGPILLINTSNGLPKFTGLFPMLDFRILEQIEDAAKFVPEELLPSDMGGSSDAPTRQEFYNEFHKRLWIHSSWFAHEELKREEELYIYSTKSDPVQLNTERGKKKRDGGVKGKPSD